MPPAEGTLQGTGAGIRPASVRGTAGYFRAAQDASGRWSLIAPDGRSFFARGVHGVRSLPPHADDGSRRDSAARLREWGFNCIGLGGDDSARLDGLPFLGAVEFCAAANVITAPGVRLPDVFDPDWPRRAAARAEQVCVPMRGCGELLGWVTDSALLWGFPAGARRPALLQVCLGLEPRFAAYHAAWEFVLAPYGGRLEALARAWGVPLANKEALREMTRAETALTGRGYGRDDARWAREFARRYFTAAAHGIRQADANHLVWGCRFGARAAGEAGRAGRPVLAECVHPAVDVALADWRELPEDGTMPLVPEVSWAAESFWSPNGGRDRALTSVERMLRRARAGLARLATHPAVAGFMWADWEDAPADLPPFGRGLVHADGREAREHTELLAVFNARADARRPAATPDFIP